MEYSNAENYLLNLYASLVKDNSYDKFKQIYYILKKIILLQVILLRLLIFIML